MLNIQIQSRCVIMDEKLMEILCCPVCKGELELKVENQDGGEIFDGELFCSICNFTYPISEGIPNLLPPEYHKNE